MPEKRWNQLKYIFFVFFFILNIGQDPVLDWEAKYIWKRGVVEWGSRRVEGGEWSHLQQVVLEISMVCPLYRYCGFFRVSSRRASRVCGFFRSPNPVAIIICSFVRVPWGMVPALITIDVEEAGISIPKIWTLIITIFVRNPYLWNL